MADLSQQLAAIPNIKASVEVAEALIAKNDYRPAVERLGEAIEVSSYTLHTKSEGWNFSSTVLPLGCPFEGAEGSVL